ncbi:hypothetical protein CRG98_009485 [Punica granatum]|uniref:Uncharacterized protein n=1 Tax=Punica granatum TaxID=22663 RepID=A0A2I0KP97_PUNGR|nr:hypothetical protein CRG98_009485 [Punica granatum]
MKITQTTSAVVAQTTSAVVDQTTSTTVTVGGQQRSENYHNARANQSLADSNRSRFRRTQGLHHTRSLTGQSFTSNRDGDSVRSHDLMILLHRHVRRMHDQSHGILPCWRMKDTGRALTTQGTGRSGEPSPTRSSQPPAGCPVMRMQRVKRMQRRRKKERGWYATEPEGGTKAPSLANNGTSEVASDLVCIGACLRRAIEAQISSISLSLVLPALVAG